MADDFNIDDIFKKWASEDPHREPVAPKAKPKARITVYLTDGTSEEFEDAQIADVGTRIILSRDNRLDRTTVFTEAAVMSYEIGPMEDDDK